MEYVDPFIFCVTLGFAVFIGYIMAPKPTIVYKFPTPKNAGKITYKDESGVCYKYKANEMNEDSIDKEKVENLKNYST